ncbi:MAG: hypothetical protein P8X98_14330, partial [Woeseiaceae bacterium]
LDIRDDGRTDAIEVVSSGRSIELRQPLSVGKIWVNEVSLHVYDQKSTSRWFDSLGKVDKVLVWHARPFLAV